MSDKSPVELILLEYECRDFGDRAFVLRINNAPWGISKIQQVAWGVGPNYPSGNPPVFCIYHGVTGFSSQGNSHVMKLPHEGELADYKPTFDEALKRAYELAKERAEFYTHPAPHDTSYDPSRAVIIDLTSFGTNIRDSQNPLHALWYVSEWYPEI